MKVAAKQRLIQQQHYLNSLYQRNRQKQVRVRIHHRPPKPLYLSSFPNPTEQ